MIEAALGVWVVLMIGAALVLVEILRAMIDITNERINLLRSEVDVLMKDLLERQATPPRAQ